VRRPSRNSTAAPLACANNRGCQNASHAVAGSGVAVNAAKHKTNPNARRGR